MTKQEALNEIHFDKINSLLTKHSVVEFSLQLPKKSNISQEITPILCEAILDMQTTARKKSQYVEASFMGIDGEVFDAMISQNIIMTNCIYKYDEILKII